ncbi:D-amino acid oxidase 2 isoform X2 [Anticarsia gemmatalis]|uniref:D-amino acid oxidase 2 isoform X2 n=1 Tax=Anticarsia gemmatalis TaxID=129554 RepID=UPI003F75DB9E
MVKVAVLGAGINGLSTAYQIKEKYKNFEVTVISPEFTPNTTGDGSGGLWLPYLTSSSNELIEKWSSETLEYLKELWLTGTVHICLAPVYELCTQKKNFKQPPWLKVVYGYQELNDRQLETYSRRYNTRYEAGHTFTSFVVPPPRVLAYFQEQFQRAGGKLVQAKPTSLQDPMLKEYDIIINCTGLGARYLVPDDKVVPIRGQIAKVDASWIKEVTFDDLGHYIIPNVDMCVLGGTRQDRYDTTIDLKDVEFIVNGAKKILPGLKHAKLKTHWSGLRPGRESIRLEPEHINGKLYIHNYGHGKSRLFQHKDPN